jgi:O-antigen/teichoic acid export membrane protein
MSKLSKNILYNLFGQGLVLVIGFVAVKYIFHRLGGEALGIIYFISTLNAVLSSVLEMGIFSTTVREISTYFELDKNYTKDLIRTFSFFYWSVYILAGLIIFFMSPFFVNRWIHLDTMAPATAINIIRILGISAILVLPSSFYASLIRGLQRMEFTNLIDVITIGLQQFGAFLILILGGGLFPVVYWLAIIYILRVIIYLLFSVHFFSFSALIPKFSFYVIKRNFKFASQTTLISIFATIHTQTDKLIISKLLPIGILGYYSFAYNSVSRGLLLSDAISGAAYPSFSALYKAGQKDDLISQYHKLQDLVCFGLLPIFAFIPFISLPLFSYLFNKEIAHLLLLPITFLSLGFYMNGTVTIPYRFSLAAGKPEITAKMNFYALFIVLPATAILIHFFGLSGAGFSWVFYHIFAYTYGVPRICKECLGIKVKDWHFHIFKIFILTILTFGLGWTSITLRSSYSLFSLMLAYLIALIFFLFFSYFLIGNELRNTLLYYLKLFKIKFIKA